MPLKLHLPDSYKCWGVSDYHFDHENIIKYDKRPFSNTVEMNKVIIENHNKVVGTEDIVIYHGDVGLRLKIDRIKELISQMNGNFYFINGNHDKEEVLAKLYPGKTADIIQLTFNNEKEPVIAAHYKFLVWDKSFHGALHTFGHSHGNIHPKYLDDRSIDVGINTNNYFPYNYGKLYRLLTRRPVKSTGVSNG